MFEKMGKDIHTKIFVLLVVSSTFADAFQLGRCPYVRPQTDFDVSNFLGNWYEYSKYLITAEVLSECITLNLEQSSSGNVSYVRTVTGKLTGVQVGVTGTAQLVRPGVLKLTSDGIAGVFVNGNVSILGTDYSSYAVLFICEELLGLGIVHNEYAFVLTRERQPDQDSIDSAKDALRNNGLSVRDLILTNQQNCTVGN